MSWPDGCIRFSSCGRAGACQYAPCQHVFRDIKPEIAEYVGKLEREGRVHADMPAPKSSTAERRCMFDSALMQAQAAKQRAERDIPLWEEALRQLDEEDKRP